MLLLLSSSRMLLQSRGSSFKLAARSTIGRSLPFVSVVKKIKASIWRRVDTILNMILFLNNESRRFKRSESFCFMCGFESESPEKLLFEYVGRVLFVHAAAAANAGPGSR